MFFLSVQSRPGAGPIAFFLLNYAFAIMLEEWPGTNPLDYFLVRFAETDQANFLGAERGPSPPFVGIMDKTETSGRTSITHQIFAMACSRDRGETVFRSADSWADSGPRGLLMLPIKQVADKHRERTLHWLFAEKGK
jgi:hypothetical protein